MHEFGIIENIFKTIEKIALENRLQIISKVVLKIGKLRQLIPEFLRFAFQTVAKNTFAENAELIIEEIPITIKCKKCQNITQLEEVFFLCPKCLMNDVEIISGKELILETIEGE